MTSVLVITTEDAPVLPSLFSDEPQFHQGRSDNKSKKYLRLDEVGPRILVGKTHYFQSLPEIHRMPSHLSDIHQLTEYLSTQQNRRERLYWEYNPSLAKLPKTQIPNFLHSSSDQIRYYLGVYRLSNQQGCFKKMGLPKELKRFGNKGPVNLLGFAIVDSSSLDIKAEAIFVVEGRDFRLFSFGQQLYLTRDKKLWPIWLTPPTNQTTRRIYNEETMNQIIPLEPFPSATKNSFAVYKRQRASCCTSQYCKGKNFNYFVSTDGRLMVDSRPMNPHIVEAINVDEPCRIQTSFQSPITQDNYTTTLEGVGTTGLFPYVTDTLPNQSFATIDEEYFPKHGVFKLPYTEERGTACCVAIPNPISTASDDDEFLLVGVSHTKIIRWEKERLESHNLTFTSRQYNSRLYAFEPKPPFRIVARSGKFCMPYPSLKEEEEEQNHNNPHTWLIRNAPFAIGTNMSCPCITFVMGITEAIDDDPSSGTSSVILSYGMNDCAARVVKVAKSELSRMLFPELMSS